MKNILIIFFLALSILILFAMFLCFLSKTHTGKIMTINIISSFTTLFIASIAIFLQESWLLDVSLVYCMISFLAVVVLTKVEIIGRKDK